jgi:signal transduction histidine kinase
MAEYAELDTQAEQLRQASDLKSRFLSCMSHEFRTPLGSILSIASLLSDELDGPLSSEQHKQVAFVSNAARELSDMVDDLLDLAKIEAGRITISPAWFDMLDLFAALRGMFRPIVDTSAVDLIFEEPVGLPQLYTDDKKLAQILRNFISNSLKFTPPWGSPGLGATGEPRLRALRRQRQRNRYRPAAAWRIVQRLLPGRLPAAKTPAWNRARVVAVQTLRGTAGRRSRGTEHTGGGLDLFRDHPAGLRHGACR